MVLRNRELCSRYLDGAHVCCRVRASVGFQAVCMNDNLRARSCSRLAKYSGRRASDVDHIPGAVMKGVWGRPQGARPSTNTSLEE
jgi:hypothetical protein